MKGEIPNYICGTISTLTPTLSPKPQNYELPNSVCIMQALATQKSCHSFSAEKNNMFHNVILEQNKEPRIFLLMWHIWSYSAGVWKTVREAKGISIVQLTR